MAACVAAAILVGVRMVAPEKNGLSMLTIPDMESSGMGFEGWLGYDITQWDNGIHGLNPWNFLCCLSIRTGHTMPQGNLLVCHGTT